MAGDAQARAVELVGEWSKWLVSVNLVATVGCVAVLQSGAGGMPRLFLLLGIGAFSFSLLVAALLLGLLPGLAQRLPVEATSVYDSRLWGMLTVRALAVTQFALFLLAAAAFLGWVVTKPVP